MARRYWLMKSEPETYSIDDLARDGTTCWNGVRNYQARNLLRDELTVGDHVLFYHSNADPPGVVGLARVVRAGYPDHTQFDAGSDYHDPAARPDDPTWYMVDLTFVDKFPRVVGLDELKRTRGLEHMMVTRRGARLSVQPVTAGEYRTVCRLADQPGRNGEPAAAPAVKPARRPAGRGRAGSRSRSRR